MKISVNGKEVGVERLAKAYAKRLNQCDFFEAAHSMKMGNFFKKMKKKYLNLNELKLLYTTIFTLLSEDEFEKFFDTKASNHELAKLNSEKLKLYNNPFDFKKDLGFNSIVTSVDPFRIEFDTDNLIKLIKMKINGGVGKFRFYSFFLITSSSEKSVFESKVKEIEALLRKTPEELKALRHQKIQNIENLKKEDADLTQQFNQLSLDTSEPNRYSRKRRYW